MPIWYSSQMSISKEGLRCEDVAQALLRAGIACSVTPNTSVQCSDTGVCKLEQGCRIVHSMQHKGEVAHAWRVLRTRFDLGCAHLSIPPIFSGCIRDFLQPSLCSTTADLGDAGED